MTKAAHFKKNKKVQKKEISFLFPDGLTCNTRYFNSTSTNPRATDLVTHFRFIGVMSEYTDDESSKLPQFSSYIFWKIAINGPHRTTDLSDDTEEDISEAYKRMSRMGFA